LFPAAVNLVFAVVVLAALLLALRWADWRQFRDPGRQHLYLGATMVLFFIWLGRVEILPGLVWHLSGMVTMTLMFGWSLSLIAGLVVLLGTIAAGAAGWDSLAPTAALQVLLTVTLTQLILGVSRLKLPRNFFVYVLVDAFLAGGVIFLLLALIGGMAATLGEVASAARVHDRLTLFLPMLFFPEAMLNGWITAALVLLRPEWISSFRDEEYIHGK
jgi:uncharacterized membrane protein